MRFRYSLFTLIAVAAVAINVEQVFAQGRGETSANSQLNQFGSPSPFGTIGQPGQGSSQQNQFGLPGNQSLQGNNLNQRQVGGQDGFIGSDAQQIRNQRNNQNQSRRSQFNFDIESFNRNRESRNRNQSNRNQKQQVRVQVRPLFTAPQPSTSELTAQVESQLRNSLPSSLSSMQVSISGSSATISGTVNTDYDKRLAAKLLEIQPGISQVKNQLIVESTSATQ